MDEELRQAFGDLWLELKEDTEPRGLSGRYRDDPTPTADLPYGQIWFRRENSDVYEAAFNLNVRTDRSDIPVFVELRKNGRYYVKGVDPESGSEALGAAASDYNRGDMHGPELGTDVPNRLLSELRIRLSEAGGLHVVIEEGIYEDASGDLHHVLEQDVDLVSAVTATSGKKAPVILGLDASDQLVTYTGTDADAGDLPTDAPYFDIDTFITTRNAATGAVIWLWGIGLSNGQTSITNVAELVHLRPYLSLAGGAGGSGTVTSVGVSVPSILTVSGSPVTGSGTIALGLATQSANTVLAGPSTGSAAAPTFRALAVADLPTVDVAHGGTGATTASVARTNLGLGTIATQNASAVTITGGSITGITDLAVADGGTGASSASAARTNLGLGTMATQDFSAVAITGGTITGLTSLTVPTTGITATFGDGTAGASIVMNGANAQDKGLFYRSGGSTRWVFEVSDTGDDWLLLRYNNSAILQGTTIRAARSDGKITLEAGLIADTNTLAVDASTHRLSVGATSSLGSKLQVTADAGGAIAANNYAQLTITGATNTNRQLRIGYDTTVNIGFLQAETAGTGYDALKLNPNGGAVTISAAGVSTTVAGPLTLGAGTATNAPLNMTSGTNLTTSAAGAVEYDGKAFYATPTANARGVLPATQFTSVTTDTALANVATAQALFGSTEDTFTLDASTTYMFEAQYYLTRAAGTTSHTTSLLFGGTVTLTSIGYRADVANPSGTALGAVSSIMGAAASALVVTAANTSATETLIISVRGLIRTNAAGTFIPQFQYSAAPGGAPTVKANSFFRLWAVGSDTVKAVGNVA